MRIWLQRGLAWAVVAAAMGCGDNGGGSSGVDGGSEIATSCSEVAITDFFDDATAVGDCTSAAGLRIAESLMNLDGITIDNNGETMTPCVEVQCDDDYAYIITNGLPHYDFVQTTPNELAEDVNVYRIPLEPSAPAGTGATDIASLDGCEAAFDAYVGDAPTNQEPAGFCANAESGYLSETLQSGTVTYAQIPCLGYFGTNIAGVNVNGPNEAANPDPWGDPAFSYPDDTSTAGAALDFCGGHTGGNMHYHALHQACFELDDDRRPANSYANAVLSWTQESAVNGACTEPSPIVGWSADGYPIKGPCVCVETDSSGACTSVKRGRSSWKYDGLSSHGAAPDASLALESSACTSDDDCCTGGVGNDCDMRCNYVLTDGSESGTQVSKVCTLLDYAWCTSVYADRTTTDTSAESFVYLDRCNGFDGPDGFAYHATGTFPYLQACYRGEPAEQALAGGPGGGGPGGGGPPGRLIVRSLAASAAAILAFACQVDAPTALGDGTSVILGPDATIEYRSEVNWQGAAETETGYLIENDLGYRFQIQQLQLAVYSVQLRPCEESASLSLGLATARADHVVSDDPSMAVVDIGEDLLQTAGMVLGRGAASGDEYCSAFMLSTVLSDSESGLAESTIVVAGSYQPPQGGEWVEFRASVPLGEGRIAALEPLVDASSDVETSSEVVVTFTRYPSLAFDGITPELLSDAELAWEILGGLLHTTTAGYRIP